MRCPPSLVPRPRPAFHCLQYGKAGRAWYLFSCEHDVISKLRKIAEQAAFRVFSTDYVLNAQCVRQSPPASQIRVVSYLIAWLFLLFWAQCAHAQSNPFYIATSLVPRPRPKIGERAWSHLQKFPYVLCQRDSLCSPILRAEVT